MTNELLTIDDHRRAYAGGLTVTGAMAALRRRFEAAGDPAMFIGGLLDDIHERAAALDALDPGARADLPLFGIPFAVKDNIDAAGVPTTAGCPGYAYTPTASAAAVQLLANAGAVLVAKANLDQFATGLVGTRSPYGTARNVLDPSIVPGGSSSGSAVAVAAGVVPFALGTDTAGSGRVPAAMNQIIGLKPTPGLVSTVGVVPACASFDCVSVFAAALDDAVEVFTLLDRSDPDDPWSRGPQPQLPLVRADRARIGIPGDSVLAQLDDVTARSFDRMLAAVSAAGAHLEPVDLGPFLEAGALLYGDALVAERHAAVGAFIAAHPDQVLDVTRTIIMGGADWTAAAYHRAQSRVRALRSTVGATWDRVDAMALPTVVRAARLDEVAADPIGANAALGRFTTFTNVLDLAALTLPDPAEPLPGAGMTLHGPAGSDRRLAALARSVFGSLGRPETPSADTGPPVGAPVGTIDVVVVGAHLEGQPLNHQLVERGGTLVTLTTTAPCYRLWALPDGRRPALERVGSGGAAIEVEIWSLPTTALGSFAREIGPPLALGTLELVDGSRRTGFVCEAGGLLGATDVTHHGAWRRWIAERDSA